MYINFIMYAYLPGNVACTFYMYRLYIPGMDLDILRIETLNF